MAGKWTPEQFVAKWKHAVLKENQGYVEHFTDLCAVLGHPTPAEADPTGATFCFQKGLTQLGGNQGYADVWKKDFFAWEYKGPDGDLKKALRQLQGYRDALHNPPLLIVSDLDRIEIHTAFTNAVPKTHVVNLDDLLTPSGLIVLRAAFFNPYALKPGETREEVTRKAAGEFTRLATALRKYGEDPHRVAHFLIRLLFCLFAEDADILPAGLFSRMVAHLKGRPKDFNAALRDLFGKMSTGGVFGYQPIPWIDGGLFDDDFTLEMDTDMLAVLAGVKDLDWAAIEPSILGTLFERGLDPGKRSQLGAHYTSQADIELIVEPVVMAPLRREWAALRAEAGALDAERQAAAGAKKARLGKQIAARLCPFRDRLAGVRVLDPACGSGNFLYVTLRLLLDLQREVNAFLGERGIEGAEFYPTVAPGQLYGLEVNPYAQELARTTVWIGYIQWLRERGLGHRDDPLLQPLDTIRLADAVLAHDAEGRPCEPAWPEVDCIVGNPPFLGDKKMLRELGDEYVGELRGLYAGRVPGQADLVCYWFERARAEIEAGRAKRAGLLATQGIRGGKNRVVLRRIKVGGDIFWAQSDRDWILDGANVHVSMVGFDDGTQQLRELDGQPVAAINADLSAAADLTAAIVLGENSGISFIGDKKKGKFEISPALAERFLACPNIHGRSNAEVIRPWMNGWDVTHRPRGMFIVDFGANMSEQEACLFEAPFDHVKAVVKPVRSLVRNPLEKRLWWVHGRTAPDMRTAISGLRTRYIATSSVSKHRVFVWLPLEVLPDGALIVFAREDDYFFGVLHSWVHELWARRTGTQLREAESGCRYTPTTTFETFPFPWPPGTEPAGDPRVEAIAAAARELTARRDAWLAADPARTLTGLYNARPDWLSHAHRALDWAVLDAYGWPRGLNDEEVLARLLALNGERGKTNA